MIDKCKRCGGKGKIYEIDPSSISYMMFAMYVWRICPDCKGTGEVKNKVENKAENHKEGSYE